MVGHVSASKHWGTDQSMDPSVDRSWATKSNAAWEGADSLLLRAPPSALTAHVFVSFADVLLCPVAPPAPSKCLA